MTYKDIPDDVRKKHVAKCNKCKHRNHLIALVDAWVDWLDCPYDCPNDYEHYLESLKGDNE